MLEILVVTALTRRIGQIVEDKGHKATKYKWMAAGLWFGGEILGAILGATIAGWTDSGQCLVYVIGLLGAGIGAAIAYSIANNVERAPAFPEQPSPNGTVRVVQASSESLVSVESPKAMATVAPLEPAEPEPPPKPPSLEPHVVEPSLSQEVVLERLCVPLKAIEWDIFRQTVASIEEALAKDGGPQHYGLSSWDEVLAYAHGLGLISSEYGPDSLTEPSTTVPRRALKKPLPNPMSGGSSTGIAQ